MSDELGRLLDALGRDPDERIAICHQDSGGAFMSELTTVEKAPIVAANYADTDCWFSVQPLHDRVADGRGREREVTGLRELYADLDVKAGGLPDYATAGGVIGDLSDMLGAHPVAVVNSGHGLQPHWQIERGPGTDWPDESDPSWAGGKALLRRWGRLVVKVAASHGGHVDNVYDLSRVLRVPGTVNRKSDPIPVTVEFNGGVLVSLQQVQETLDAYGIPELAEDSERLGETVAPSVDWATCRYVAAMVSGWTDETPTERHPWLISKATRLAAAHRLGCITEADHAQAVRALTARFRVLIRMRPARDEHPNEIGEALAWGIKRVEAKTDEQVRRELSDHRHPGDTPTVEVDGFWDARQELAHIRRFARARQVSPWAVLLAVLARVVVAVGPQLQIAPPPAWRSLNLFVALVGASGGGKDTALEVAADAVNVGEITVRTPGSGEGIAHSFVARNKKTNEIERHTTAVLFFAAEVEALTQLAKRQGSVLGSELRIAWGGQQLGFNYSDAVKRLLVKPHSYRLCLIVGVQPECAAPLILDGAGAGTPQRFVWTPAEDPDAPDADDLPDEPEPIVWRDPTYSSAGTLTDPGGRRAVKVCDAVLKIIQRGRTERLRGNGHTLDAHANLCQLKVAVALALLDGRTDVNEEDWKLAGQIMAVSDATRKKVLDTLNERRQVAVHLRGREDAERAIKAEEHTDEHHIQRIAKWAGPYLRDHGEMTRAELRRKVAGKYRRWFDEGMELAVRFGEVKAVGIPGQGGSGCKYRAAS